MASVMTAPEGGGRLVRIAPGAREADTAWVGMVIFLGSWTVMFAALFFAYGLLRVQSSVWPPDGYARLPLLLPAINTAVLLLSSVALHRGQLAVRSNRPLFPWLLTTLGLGLVFLALQGVVWNSLWLEGFVTASGRYGSIFYTLTAFHALHVLVGLGFLLWLIPRSLQSTYTPRDNTPVRLTAMFWHFVDIVWIVLFVTVYVL